MNENGIVSAARADFELLHTSPKSRSRSSSSGKSLKSTMETVTVTSKPMDGVSYRETNKQDSVGKIREKNITGTKQAIYDAAARLRAKRGFV